nr:unnamed protein product [Spirometra erinaceieuropaei]
MGEIGTNLLRRRIAEQAREQSTIRDAALENKFRKLPNPTSPRNDKQVHNLSSKELTKDQMQVLRHEASFNTADAKPVNMIAAVKSILCQTEATEETKNLIRHQVSSLLMAHRPREVLSKVERDALRELKADEDLVIVPADKGRATVVLDRTDYLQKAKGLLEDRQFYVPCATNPLKALTREINATLLALENSGAITPTDRRTARPQDTALARFYGLPKVHKDGAPLRPIVSLKGTPTYGLAKWLFRRLKFLTAETDTTISSSARFLEKLKGDLAIETIELLLQSKYDETENRLGHAQILQLLKLCLRTYFTFDGTIYEQVKGTPMGSPISGFIAEAVLQRLESLVFQHHRPKFWARYVDDTFVVIERDQVLTFQEHLNAVFPDIQFTMEEEENNQLAFLDVLVCRKDCGGLKTKVFRKATNTMQVLNFNSNHPISHKRSCVRTLYRRVETHCSEPEDKIAELQYLRRVFKANGYPRNFVDRCIRKRDERPNRTDTKSWRALPCDKTRPSIVPPSHVREMPKTSAPREKEKITAGGVPHDWVSLPDNYGNILRQYLLGPRDPQHIKITTVPMAVSISEVVHAAVKQVYRKQVALRAAKELKGVPPSFEGRRERLLHGFGAPPKLNAFGPALSSPYPKLVDIEGVTKRFDSPYAEALTLQNLEIAAAFFDHALETCDLLLLSCEPDSPEVNKMNKDDLTLALTPRPIHVRYNPSDPLFATLMTLTQCIENEIIYKPTTNYFERVNEDCEHHYPKLRPRNPYLDPAFVYSRYVPKYRIPT